MKPHILIAEDDDALSDLLVYNLEKQGFDVTPVKDGEKALAMIEERRPDLLLLDWMLPSVSGIEICRQLRAKPDTQAIGIIMLSARGEEYDRVRGLETGADDYMTKPFSVTELLARIQSVMRRSHPEIGADNLTVGDIRIDRLEYRVERAGKEIHLGPKEFRLLDWFMCHPGRVFSREQLLDNVWGSDVYVELRTVDVHVGRLRKALRKNGGSDPIRTVRSAGYSLVLK